MTPHLRMVPHSPSGFAAAYLIVVMIGAGPLGLDLGGGTTAGVTRYPYTFLDPAISGDDETLNPQP